jgi:hypothetical protein
VGPFTLGSEINLIGLSAFILATAALMTQTIGYFFEASATVGLPPSIVLFEDKNTKGLPEGKTFLNLVVPIQFINTSLDNRSFMVRDLRALLELTVNSQKREIAFRPAYLVETSDCETVANPAQYAACKNIGETKKNPLVRTSWSNFKPFQVKFGEVFNTEVEYYPVVPKDCQDDYCFYKNFFWAGDFKHIIDLNAKRAQKSEQGASWISGKLIIDLELNHNGFLPSFLAKQISCVFNMLWDGAQDNFRKHDHSGIRRIECSAAGIRTL